MMRMRIWMSQSRALGTGAARQRMRRKHSMAPLLYQISSVGGMLTARPPCRTGKQRISILNDGLRNWRRKWTPPDPRRRRAQRSRYLCGWRMNATVSRPGDCRRRRDSYMRIRYDHSKKKSWLHGLPWDFSTNEDGRLVQVHCRNPSGSYVANGG